MELPNFNMSGIKDLLSQIGLANPEGKEYDERQKKCDQLYDYFVIFEAVLKKLSTKRTLTLLDCACGRGYLSFFLNYALKTMGRSNLRFIGIDTNEDLIKKCRLTASALDYSNMEFYSEKIIDCCIEGKTDIVYSLHACDTATDQTILKGIMTGAHSILSVSCCQHYTRNQMKKHPLTSVTKHPHYKERMSDMISDSLRALLLEAYGYKVDIFEFTSSKSTPKNIMLRAEKINTTDKRRSQAFNEYAKLSDMFHVKPALEFYLSEPINLYNIHSPNMEVADDHAYAGILRHKFVR